MVKILFRTALQGCFVVVDDLLFCIVTFNLWLHFNKLLTYFAVAGDLGSRQPRQLYGAQGLSTRNFYAGSYVIIRTQRPTTCQQRCYVVLGRYTETQKRYPIL